MGLVKRWILGRWLVRWLFRGSPLAVAAKLAAVGLWGAWRWRRERAQEEAARRSREIEADYEVIGPVPIPPPEPPMTPGGTADDPETDDRVEIE